MKLPKKLKTKWLKALRSGEYKQARSTMYNPKTGGFCCLGVLEHVCMDGEVEAREGVEHYFDQPSKAFWDYIGAEVGDGYCDSDIDTLIEMNDGKHDWASDRRSGCRQFTTIANWIEKNVETL